MADNNLDAIETIDDDIDETPEPVLSTRKFLEFFLRENDGGNLEFILRSYDCSKASPEISAKVFKLENLDENLQRLLSSKLIFLWHFL